MPSVADIQITRPVLSEPPSLSARGQRSLVRPPLLRCSLFNCQYNACLNQAGLLNLGVAENSLCLDWLTDFFQAHFSLDYTDFTYGSALTGSLRLFAALRHFFDVYFNARTPVLPEHIIAGTGCSSILDALAAVLADPGDGILCARPHYNGFQPDFAYRNDVHVVGVDLPDGKEASPASLDAFEQKMAACTAAGQKISAILLCNPNNPLGFCYPRETLIAYCRFAEKHNLHLIVDEIYALSTYDSDHRDPQPLVSILSLDALVDAGCNPSRIHCVYGPSKDFGVNGLRLGVLVSQANPDLHVAMEANALLMKISSASDVLWSNLLLDPVGLPTYLALNKARLGEAYRRATAFLQKHDIPYRPAHAGHFVWIDLRRYLPESDEEGTPLVGEAEREVELVKRFLAHGINLGRGVAYDGKPGFFRLTFTLRPEYFDTGIRRLEAALGLTGKVNDGCRRLITA
ncbi:hypothetical protein C6P46_005665 [Rhodotorula mucilaginosa]|uniref:Aminotransferase class I/classII large domain-containing protein n=1 Tax=Rhodotorula mucilaginosa TaxID=5537 RepID=A0A9P7B4T5_RHOMI|nr:hypothetical protein C6P46_005665 [Rhodotorula mucilaginosa]